MSQGSEAVDVLIIGGGLIGSALALALAHTKLKVKVIESSPLNEEISKSFDARTLALSGASVKILKMLNVWQRIEAHATPIQKVHISEQKRFGQASIAKKQHQALGYVVEMQYLRQAFYQTLDHNVVIAPAKLNDLSLSKQQATLDVDGKISHVRAKLIVAADGAQSSARAFCGIKAKTKDYHQSAVIANIGLARDHQNCAYERFTSTGPMAMLPMNDSRAALVWTLPTQDAELKMNLSEPDFLNALQKTFGYRLGRLKKMGERQLFPLKQIVAEEQVKWPLMLIGNAAHALHPVAGQGFNLGLRDVALLSQYIVRFGIQPEMAQKYLKDRKHDQSSIVHFTNGLIDVFGCQLPGLGHLRSLGLMAFDQSRWLKNIMAKYAGGFSGVISDLVCGIPLNDEDISELSI